LKLADVCYRPRIGSIFYPMVSLGYLDLFRLDLARKKLAKGECVAKKARDKVPV